MIGYGGSNSPPVPSPSSFPPPSPLRSPPHFRPPSVSSWVLFLPRGRKGFVKGSETGSGTSFPRNLKQGFYPPPTAALFCHATSARYELTPYVGCATAQSSMFRTFRLLELSCTRVSRCLRQCPLWWVGCSGSELACTNLLRHVCRDRACVPRYSFKAFYCRILCPVGKNQVACPFGRLVFSASLRSRHFLDLRDDA